MITTPDLDAIEARAKAATPRQTSRVTLEAIAFEIERIPDGIVRVSAYNMKHILADLANADLANADGGMSPAVEAGDVAMIPEPFLPEDFPDTETPDWHARAMDSLAKQLGVMNDFYYPLLTVVFRLAPAAEAGTVEQPVAWRCKILRTVGYWLRQGLRPKVRLATAQ